jgi:hypothetical protein
MRQLFHKSTKRSPAGSAARAGISLTELLVVMTIASVLIGVTGTMIHRLLAADHEATRAARFATSVARLSRAFRADVHAARAIELPAPNEAQPAIVVATLADGHQVRYELDAHLATRVETREDAVIHRDVYHFPPRSQLRCSRGDDAGLFKLELNLAARGPEPDAERPVRKLVVEAALARDHRFEPPPRQEAQTP